MAKRRKKDFNPFNRELDGGYGVFKTEKSHKLGYLLTSMNLSELDRLETANQALNFKRIDFEQLVQRDVDYKRVQNEIVKYLQSDSDDNTGFGDSVIFFPPVLATLLPLDTDGGPLRQLSGVDESRSTRDEYICRWGETKYELELPLEETATDRKIQINGEERYYLKHAATIRYNADEVKLVVIDGQHRFEALRELRRIDADAIRDVELPVCVFFSPEAIIGSTVDLSRNLRELFVKINSTAKHVSGHFIVLLNDKSLSSLAVREFANDLKVQSNQDKIGLHLLEWNQRENSKSHQRTKGYSITTVSILADAFCKIFKNVRSNMPGILLNLQEVEGELERCENPVDISEIGEASFAQSQTYLLKQQIKEYITPSLGILLKQPRPYSNMEISFDKAISSLNEEIDNGVAKASEYKRDFLMQFREVTSADKDYIQTYNQEFESNFVIIDEDSFYFKNIFQTGYIWAWADLCKALCQKYGIDTAKVAFLVTQFTSPIVFDDTVKMFNPSREYTQQILFDGTKIKANDTSRNGVRALILSSLLNESAMSNFVREVKAEQREDLQKDLQAIAEAEFNKYFKQYKKTFLKKITKDWRVMDIPDEVYNYLQQRADSTEDEKVVQFEEKIEELARERTKKAKAVLSSLLGLTDDE